MGFNSGFKGLIYSVLWSCLLKCNNESDYRISLPIRSAAFLWASLRSGSRHIMFPDHLTGRCVLPYLSIPLQNGTVQHRDCNTDNTASWVTVAYVITSSLVYPVWCYKLRCSTPPKQQLTSAYCTDTCQLTIRYVAEGLARVECCANRNWVYILSTVYADTGELGWNSKSNTLENNRPQHVLSPTSILPPLSSHCAFIHAWKSLFCVFFFWLSLKSCKSETVCTGLILH